VFLEGGSALPVDAFRVIAEGTIEHVQEQRVPVREGQEVTVELEFSLTYSPRDAVGYVDGYMIIVEGGRQHLGKRRKVRVTEIAQRAAEAAPIEIALADTIGAGVPAQVSEVLGRVREALPGLPLRGHFHNTRNTGLANAYAAVQAGVTTLDSSLGGIGGCPFAPAATGNIPTEDLLYMLGRCGYDTGVSLAAAIETGKWLQDRLGHTLPGMLLKAGEFPRSATTVA